VYRQNFSYLDLQYNFWFLFILLIFPELFQVKLVPQNITYGSCCSRTNGGQIPFLLQNPSSITSILFHFYWKCWFNELLPVSIKMYQQCKVDSNNLSRWYYYADIPAWSSPVMDQQWYVEASQTPTLSIQLHTCRIWCVPGVYPEALAPTSTLCTCYITVMWNHCITVNGCV